MANNIPGAIIWYEICYFSNISLRCKEKSMKRPQANMFIKVGQGL